MFINQLKIENFMSFVGENFVSLKSYSAVMVVFEKGKHDFIAALNFLFGANLSVLGVEHVEELYHDCLISTKGSDLPRLEVTALFDTRREDSLKMTRLFVNKSMSYILNDKIVDFDTYLNVLRGMRCDGRFFISLCEFCEAMWNSEGIEKVIEGFVGLDLKYSKLQKALKNVIIMEKAVALQSEKKYISMKKTQMDVDEVVSEFDRAMKDQETRWRRVFEGVSYEIENLESPSLLIESATSSLQEQLSSTLNILEEVELEKKLEKARLNEAELSASLMYKESKMVDDELAAIQAHVAKKVRIESRISNLEKIQSEIYQEIEVIVEEFGTELASLQEYFEHPKVRLTSYGRFIDWIKPGKFLWILKAVLGELLYGHLIDNREPAEKFVRLLKERYTSSRVTFIILSNYNPKLKEIIFGGGETGVVLKDMQEVIKFLCQLKEFALIDQVPLFVHNSDLSDGIPELEEEALFLSAGEFVGEYGIFGRYCTKADAEISIHDVKNNIKSLFKLQEALFDQLRDVIFEMHQQRLDLDSLTKDMKGVRTRRPTLQPETATYHSQLNNIYQEYSGFFEEVHQPVEEVEFEPISAVTPLDVKQLQADVMVLKRKIIGIRQEKKTIEHHLKLCRQKHREMLTSTLQVIWNPILSFPSPEPEKDKAILALDLRIKALKKIVLKEEVELISYGKEWRSALLEKLCEDYNDTRKALKHGRKEVKDLLKHREMHLAPFIRYCNDTLPAMLQSMSGGEMTLGEVRCEDGYPTTLLTGSPHISLMDISNHNVTLRTISLLALFLLMARFRGGVILVVDDLQSLLPRNDADAANVLSLPTEMGARFHLLTCIGHTIKQYLDQTREEVGSSPHGEDLCNLEQVLLLTADDIATTTAAQVLIVKDVFHDPGNGGRVWPISRLLNIQ